MLMVTDAPLLKCMIVPCWMVSLAEAAAVAGLIFFGGASSTSESLPDELDSGMMANLLARCAEFCNLMLMPLYEIHCPDGVINNDLMLLLKMLWQKKISLLRIV
eukprot:3603498-Amphidinium_carterae.1